MTTTRRSFLHGMGGLGAAATGFGTAGAALAAPARRKAAAPSDRIRVGAIGVRGMGSSNMGSMLDIDGVECAALCDVDRNVLDRAVEGFTELTDSKPDAYTDYRKLLEDDELDAVIVATPDHWHCKIMVDACEAGKD
ncbi:MAG: Gfo/Idh/MocA family oxidoreductase, partial [Acidobacteriota bacterium]|nr:Gfo/Idh/MocA family oxidoreductase [Acidobacteriota bacterium]